MPTGRLGVEVKARSSSGSGLISRRGPRRSRVKVSGGPLKTMKHLFPRLLLFYLKYVHRQSLAGDEISRHADTFRIMVLHMLLRIPSPPASLISNFLLLFFSSSLPRNPVLSLTYIPYFSIPLRSLVLSIR